MSIRIAYHYEPDEGKFTILVLPFLIEHQVDSQYSAKDNIYTYYLKTRPILILQGIESFVQ